MRKPMRFVGVVLLLVTLVALATVPHRQETPAFSSQEPAQQSHSTANSRTSQENSGLPAMAEEMETREGPYLVREYEGRIGVFLEGELLPLQELPVVVAELPKTDQLLLASGIPAESKQELLRILEDYGS